MDKICGTAARSTRKLSYRKYRPMDALKNFQSPDYTPTAAFPDCNGLLFLPIDTKNVHTKFEERSFTRS